MLWISLSQFVSNLMMIELNISSQQKSIHALCLQCPSNVFLTFPRLLHVPTAENGRLGLWRLKSCVTGYYRMTSQHGAWLWLTLRWPFTDSDIPCHDSWLLNEPPKTPVNEGETLSILKPLITWSTNTLVLHWLIVFKNLILFPSDLNCIYGHFELASKSRLDATAWMIL